jgi:glutathione peroxidase
LVASVSLKQSIKPCVYRTAPEDNFEIYDGEINRPTPRVVSEVIGLRHNNGMANLYDIPVNKITGESTSLADYRGKVLLVVNTASKCGLTAQYEALEGLYQRRKADGFEILAFPANDFAGQEPGSNEEIATFCKTSFHVSFPLFQKISVAGADTHPLYQELIAAQPKATTNEPGAFRKKLIDFGITPNSEPSLLWNFEKFVIDRNGKVVARLSPEITPDDPLVTEAIDAALKQ